MAKTKFWGSAAAIAAFVIPAVVGFVWSSMDSARKDALAYTNLQIEKLYGPLYGITQSMGPIWFSFDRGRDSAKEQEEWRDWMETIFQPMNLKIEKIILDNSQLIVGNEMPSVFLQAIANTEIYGVLIKRWGSGDYDDIVTPVRFPDQIGNSIVECVKQTYFLLKERQQELQKWQTRVYFLDPPQTPADCAGASPSI